MQSIRKKSFAAEQLALRQQKKVSPVVLVLLGVVVVALVVGGYVMYQRNVKEEVETEQIKSIAVLPFVDMSPEKDQEWFCDGVVEGIINAMTNVRDLQVTGRTSAFAFKDKGLGIPEIGEKLNVEAVLEGSILKSGNRILITAQLIKVSDGFHLWSQEYNRELKDVIDIRAEISIKIVEALKVELLGDEKAAIEKRYTENIEAWNLYKRGRYQLNDRSEEGVNKAVSYFKRAIEIDSNYALAYAGIADSYNLLGISHYISPKEASIEVNKWAKEALEIDEKIAEAHKSLASAHLWYDWDWETAQKEYIRAIELNPSNADTYFWYADYFRVMGKYEEALESLKRAHEIDPLSYIINLLLSESYFLTGRTEEAVKQCHKAIELNPNDGRGYSTLGWMLGELA